MRTNKPLPRPKTHEGGPAVRISAVEELRRTLLACLLWERNFYESGVSIAERIHTLADQCPPETVAALAIEARTKHHLRHAPLWLLLSLAKRGGPMVRDTVRQVVNRPDEIPELISMLWQGGKKNLPRQLQKGLADAFNKFDAYQLAKWNRPGNITLRDAMFLTHPKPETEEQAQLFKQLANNELPTPNTWESRLASGEDKKQVFEDLLENGKLGYLALLRNLRGMTQAGVYERLIRNALLQQPARNVLPFRFIAAAEHAPRFEPELDQAMIKAMEGAEKLPGPTVLLVDVSGSMGWKLSEKSDLTRLSAACGLAILCRGVCEYARVFTFSNSLVEVAPRQGMALKDAVINSQFHGGTALGGAIHHLNQSVLSGNERLIVITDEQTADRVPAPKAERAYMINVASHKNGVGYRNWVHIDGFSEACIKFIQEYERAQ